MMRYQYDANKLRQHIATSTYHSLRGRWSRWAKPRDTSLFRRGTKWHRRYLTSGEIQHLQRALRNLSEAVWGRARSAGKINTDRRHWAEYVNNFSVALLDGYQYSNDISHLDNAIAWLRRASEKLDDDTPARARVLLNLITAVETRLAAPGKQVALPDLVEMRQKLATTVSAPVRERLAAAKSWGQATAEAENPAAGLAGLATAVELLPQAAWWGHSRDSREQLLADNTALATDAAACAVAANQPGRALELLEGGRAVIWTQLLMTRTDRTALRAVAPRLAKRMDRVAAALERDSMSTDRRMLLVTRWSKMDAKAQVRLDREWASLARRAQEVLPNGAFTMPSFGSDLRPAGAEGPVVIINVSAFGCCALIVRGDEAEPQVVPLPQLAYEDVHAHAREYLSAFTGNTEARENIVDATLEWMWQVIVSPVLDSLDFPEQMSTESDWPRVWWCPTGPLTMLPLHAAGDHGTSVLDHVISSYTPALKVLVHARKNRDATSDDTGRRLLHVTMSDTIPAAARTRSYLANLLPADRRTTLDETEATLSAVKTELRQHVWAHFDCHGVQHLDHPFQGGLVIRDETLTVAELMDVRHEGAELAFLAACTTALGGMRIPDEVITLTAAMQHAGYQNVIGVLWTVPDRSAERITQAVYNSITVDGQLRPSQSAVALHHAVCEERVRRGRYPSAWVAFVHIGL